MGQARYFGLVRWAACTKITVNGVLKHLNYCVIYIVDMLSSKIKMLIEQKKDQNMLWH